MNKAIKEKIIECLKNDEEIPAEYEEDLFPTTKKEYELKYAGKERKEVILNDTMSVPFQAVKHFGDVKESEWANMLIFGDNLQSLKHLIKLKNEGKLKNSDGTDGVKLVYIDPPFATKQDFKGNQEQKAYQDKIVGAKFIEFLRKRLILLKELMSDNGIIFLHMDVKKIHYIKIILDEVFGESNFINEIIWRNVSVKNDLLKTSFSIQHNTILMYSKTGKYLFNPQFIKPSKEFTEKNYRYDDGDGKGQYTTGPLYSNTMSGGYAKGKPFLFKGLLKRWIYSKNKLELWDSEGRLYKTNTGGYRKKVYLNESLGIPVTDLWIDNEVGFLTGGMNEYQDYPTQKSESLINRFILTSSNPGDIVLDCFAGSGTTGAVAEKLGRKWIMADCGKLAIYTIEKRMMNLKKEIGNKGDPLKPKPFVLYNAGLYYDGKMLEQMKGEEYKNFVLELFGCQKRDHKINGVNFHGTLNNHSVMIFDKENDLTEEFVKDELHKVVGKDVKDELYIIAPVGVVGFNQDYIAHGKVKYTILRIPNSIIDYIKEKNFTKLEQPRTAEDVNQTIDAVGFDFIYPPRVKVEYSSKGKKKTLEIKDFEPIQLGSKIVEFKDPKSESLAMVMIDLNYNGETFQMDKYYFGDEIKKNEFKVEFDDEIGDKLMIIYLDIFGNEKREVIKKDKFEK